MFAVARCHTLPVVLRNQVWWSRGATMMMMMMLMTCQHKANSVDLIVTTQHKLQPWPFAQDVLDRPFTDSGGYKIRTGARWINGRATRGVLVRSPDFVLNFTLIRASRILAVSASLFSFPSSERGQRSTPSPLCPPPRPARIDSKYFWSLFKISFGKETWGSCFVLLRLIFPCKDNSEPPAEHTDQSWPSGD